ncbi:MAG: phosphatidylserine/phosphatidylglycerophosphate/cardiolipin synthase family protein [Bacteriovoracaceae bacterium]|jgi:phosphatidylserine/phosphatidylglycerophosphate/cardiolipin synthase-like enzyme|nr:phosphatidylserine/phosphatidylglycerophosphate/cardiolipin synthase family protein [Bacteriovoracaceae bacterium]
MKKLIALTLIVLSTSVFSKNNITKEKLISKLIYKELAFNGIDADVRRLLFDKNFQQDLAKWWMPVNDLFIDEALGEFDRDDVSRAKKAQVKKWARVGNLRAKQARILSLRREMESLAKSFIPSEKVRKNLAYFLETKQLKKAENLLQIYIVSWALYAQELLGDPSLTNTLKENGGAKNRLTLAAGLIDIEGSELLKCRKQNSSASDIRNCLIELPTHSGSKRRTRFSKCVHQYQSPSDIAKVKKCFVATTVMIQMNGKSITDLLGGEEVNHLMSPAGFIPGNKVSILNENRHDPQILRELEKMYEGEKNPIGDIFDIYNPASFGSANDNILLQAPQDIFSEKDSIFAQMIKAMKEAKHTIFVDIFFMGGTMGTSVAKILEEKAKEGVKVLLLKDNTNYFAHFKEMRPIFEYLASVAKTNSNLTVGSSYVMASPTGLPKYFDEILPDDYAKSLLDQLSKFTGAPVGLYPKAKSDHSKVMVIDGVGAWADSTPTAFVGSKNWTDSSGGMTFDEVARIEGPAAIAVQDSYYWDMWYALRAGDSINKPKSSQEIEIILSSFDVLKRKWDASSKSVASTVDIEDVKAPIEEHGFTVRLGQNNFDGSIQSAVDQNIRLIRRAKKQIIINDQFLFEKRIVSELIKKADKHPEVSIYIMLEPLSEHSGEKVEDLGGFPNTMYLDHLLYKLPANYDRFSTAQKEVSAYAKRANVHFKWKKVPHSSEFHLEYHIKSLSIDGFNAKGNNVTAANIPALITGSANKDFLTMSGAFREMQVEIYDPRPCPSESSCGSVSRSDKTFWARWNNVTDEKQGEGSVSIEGNPYNFKLPAVVEKMVEKALGRKPTSRDFIIFVRKMYSWLYDLEDNSVVE